MTSPAVLVTAVTAAIREVEAGVAPDVPALRALFVQQADQLAAAAARTGLGDLAAFVCRLELAVDGVEAGDARAAREAVLAALRGFGQPA